MSNTTKHFYMQNKKCKSLLSVKAELGCLDYTLPHTVSQLLVSRTQLRT